MKGILKHLAKYYKIHRIYGFQNLVTLPKYLYWKKRAEVYAVEKKNLESLWWGAYVKSRL